jgi:hypothetical protein
MVEILNGNPEPLSPKEALKRGILIISLFFWKIIKRDFVSEP